MNDNKFKNLYAQFIIDLPRLTFYLDNELCKKSYEYVYDYLFTRLTNKQLNFCLYFLTQSSLAEYYIKEHKKLKNDSEHLVDDGSYVVMLDTTLKTIKVSKNFRKIYLEDSVHFELDFADLNISYDLEKDIICHSWDYEFNENDNHVIITKQT